MSIELDRCSTYAQGYSKGFFGGIRDCNKQKYLKLPNSDLNAIVEAAKEEARREARREAQIEYMERFNRFKDLAVEKAKDYGRAYNELRKEHRRTKLELQEAHKKETEALKKEAEERERQHVADLQARQKAHQKEFEKQETKMQREIARERADAELLGYHKGSCIQIRKYTKQKLPEGKESEAARIKEIAAKIREHKENGTLWSSDWAVTVKKGGWYSIGANKPVDSTPQEDDQSTPQEADQSPPQDLDQSPPQELDTYFITLHIRE